MSEFSDRLAELMRNTAEGPDSQSADNPSAAVRTS